MELISTENAHNNKYNTTKRNVRNQRKVPKRLFNSVLFYVSFVYGNGFIIILKSSADDKEKKSCTGVEWRYDEHERIVLLPNTCPVISYFRFRVLKKICSNRYGPFPLIFYLLSCIIILFFWKKILHNNSLMTFYKLELSTMG